MQHYLSVNPIVKPNMSSRSNVIFKNTTEEKHVKYQKALEKRAYIDNGTEMLNDLGVIAFGLSLFLGVHHVNGFKDKLSTPQKFGVGAFVIAFASFVASFVKGIKLAKQYDKENN